MLQKFAMYYFGNLQRLALIRPRFSLAAHRTGGMTRKARVKLNVRKNPLG